MFWLSKVPSGTLWQRATVGVLSPLISGLGELIFGAVAGSPLTPAATYGTGTEVLAIAFKLNKIGK